MHLARGAHRTRVVACIRIHDVKQRRRVSSLPRRVSWPGFAFSLCYFFPLFTFLVSFPFLLPFSSLPPCPRVALHRVRPRRGRRSAGGARVPREHPAVRAMTGTRALVRRSSPRATGWLASRRSTEFMDKILNLMNKKFHTGAIPRALPVPRWHH